METFVKFGAIIILTIASIGFGGAVLAQDSTYQRCEPNTDCIVGEFIFADDGYTPVTTDNYCQITVTNPSDTVIVNGANMSHKNDGWYYYTANVASPVGLYRATMCCDTGAARACEDKSFILGTSFDSLSSGVLSRASQSSVDAIRASQQKQWTVYLSGNNSVATGNTYRAKLWILNYESVPTDPVAVPTVTIYDAVRNAVVTAAPTTKISTGIYEYVLNVSSSAVQGNWETAGSVQVESGKTVSASHFWSVAGAPAQIKINSVAGTTIPNILANITLTNEGTVNYEYSYEWCVVSSQDNACGGNDDVFYSSAAKLVQAGQNWDTDLAATVPNAGNYWFKVVVHFGTQQSGASQSFTAVKQGGGGGGGPGGGGGSSGGQSNLLQNVANGISAAGQAICNQNTFPCNIILRILAWMDTSDKKTADLENKIAQMDKKLAAMASASLVKAAPQKINVKPVPQKPPVAKKRANFFVE